VRTSSALVAVSLAALAALAGLAPLAARADVPEDPWEKDEPRPFLSSTVELGVPEHLELAAGYGKPFFLWGGLQAEAWLAPDFAAAVLSLRANLRAVDLVAGLRTTRSFRIMPLSDVHRHESLPRAGGFTYRTLDLTGSGGLPVAGGLAFWQLQAVHLLDAPRGSQVYELLQGLVCRPSWCASAQAGWLLQLRQGALSAGPWGEWAFQNGRSGTAPLVRAGALLSWRLWPHVQLQGGLLYPVSDPDRLPFTNRVHGALVLSYGIATGAAPPRFP
jgi:hypothetical protein